MSSSECPEPAMMESNDEDATRAASEVFTVNVGNEPFGGPHHEPETGASTGVTGALDAEQAGNISAIPSPHDDQPPESIADGENGPQVCIACLEVPASRAIAPCNHVVLCDRCATRVLERENPRCPVCRVPCFRKAAEASYTATRARPRDSEQETCMQRIWFGVPVVMPLVAALGLLLWFFVSLTSSVVWSALHASVSVALHGLATRAFLSLTKDDERSKFFKSLTAAAYLLFVSCVAVGGFVVTAILEDHLSTEIFTIAYCATIALSVPMYIRAFGIFGEGSRRD